MMVKRLSQVRQFLSDSHAKNKVATSASGGDGHSGRAPAAASAPGPLARDRVGRGGGGHDGDNVARPPRQQVPMSGSVLRVPQQKRGPTMRGSVLRVPLPKRRPTTPAAPTAVSAVKKSVWVNIVKKSKLDMTLDDVVKADIQAGVEVASRPMPTTTRPTPRPGRNGLSGAAMLDMSLDEVIERGRRTRR
jgi:hypothetical protein